MSQVQSLAIAKCAKEIAIIEGVDMIMVGLGLEHYHGLLVELEG